MYEIEIRIFNRIRPPNIEKKKKLNLLQYIFFQRSADSLECALVCISTSPFSSFITMLSNPSSLKSYILTRRTNDFLLNHANEVKQITARETTNYGT